MARALHDLSARRLKPFVAVNCAAIPETLIESEIFGHEKGAFTGALERRAGCFELAEEGDAAARRNWRDADGDAGEAAAGAGGQEVAAAGEQGGDAGGCAGGGGDE